MGAWWCTWIDHWRLYGGKNWSTKHITFEQYFHFDWNTLSGKFNLQLDAMLQRPRMAFRLSDSAFLKKTNQKDIKILISKRYAKDHDKYFI